MRSIILTSATANGTMMCMPMCMCKIFYAHNTRSTVA